MKTIPKQIALCAALLAAAPLLARAQDGQLAARPLTHQDIADYGLPEETQASGGLFTIGVGQPAYLEAQVSNGIAPGAIQDVAWELTDVPFGSQSTLEESPLGPEIPIFSMADRAVFQVAGRKLLKPDRVGQYAVKATVTTDEGVIELTQTITASTYRGWDTCRFCHSGGFLPDKVGPWSETGHASMFTEAIDGLKSSHYNEGCIQCHTLGYDTDPEAVNNGFDDRATDLGWTFPAELTNGNWAAMPEELQFASNIQCENCHGPGDTHANSFGNTDFISVSFSAGDCAQCHSEEPYHIKPIEWQNSKHAVATRYPTGEGRESCVGCHSGIGFVDRVDGADEFRTGYEAITCAACHDPHSAENPHQLRTLADVTLNDTSNPGGPTVITQGGKGKLCMNCHMSRRDAETYAVEYHSHFGPHHGPQADMLAGVNAVTYGQTIPSSAHLTAVGDSCVVCHLQETDRSNPEHTHAGGHTFKPSWDGGTPDDPSDDVDLVGACMGCHGPITSFDFPRQDYDGNGVIEGVQTEVEGLMHDLAMMLPPIGEPTVSVTADYTSPQLQAAYNYLMVEEDGSRGVHNLSFAVGILKASMEHLTDDADRDGLLDTWEKTHYGDITLYNGQDDPDNDGANNALEQSAGTIPVGEVGFDTDADSFSDFAELQAGSDPTSAEDTPGFILKIYNAAELEFASEIGKTYQVQAVSELTGAWVDVGDPIEGTGEMVSRLTSIRGTAQAYYRVVEVGSEN